MSTTTCPEPVFWAFRTDTAELLTPRPLRMSLYDARIHLHGYTVFHPEVDPSVLVLVERVANPDGTYTDTVHFNDADGDKDDADDMYAFAELMTEALQRDLVFPDDFAA